MRKFFFVFLLAFFTSYGAVYALTCVPKTHDPAPTDTAKYLQIYKTSYAHCGGGGDGFYNCAVNTIATGYDGALHKCTKKGWEQIDFNKINNCNNNLLTTEQTYDGNSNLGVLFGNSQAQQNWILYYTPTTNDGNYIGIKKDEYCKYSKRSYTEQMNECLYTKQGDFLSRTTDGDIVLCNPTPQTSLTITVQDTNNATLSEVQISYEDSTNNTQISTNSDGTATLTFNDKAQYQVVYFHKEGYTDVNKTISSVRRNPTIKLAKLPKTDPQQAKTSSNTETGAPGEETIINQNTDENEIQQQEAAKRKELAEKLKSAKDALDKAKEKENSWANRGLTAASTAAAGLGTMQLAEGIAEQRADSEAETDMRAYMATMKCNYGNGQNIAAGNEEIFLPGGNELSKLYAEYKTLADNLKITKAALGLRPGIESEVLYDRAESGLYKNASTGKTGGAYTSLSRAMQNPEGEDAAAWAEQKQTASQKLKAGGITAGTGVVGGAVGDYLINERDQDDDK